MSELSGFRGRSSCDEATCNECKPAESHSFMGYSAQSWTTSLLRSLQWSLVAFFLVACGGGGCGGCEECGVSPIPGGFPIEERVSNSAQVRLTSSGIDFIEANSNDLVSLLLPDGLQFDIPRTETSADLTICEPDIIVCPDNDCAINGEIEELILDPNEPNQLLATVRVRLQTFRCDASGDCSLGALPIRLEHWACGGGVLATIDTTPGSRPDIGITATINFETETELARNGYTRLVVTDAQLEEGRSLEDEDIDIEGDGGIVGFLAGFLSGLIVDQVEGQVGDLLQGALDDQLCTTTTEYGCPTGTCSDDPADPGSTCRFGAADGSGTCTAGGRCVPLLLGTDGEGDLGAAFLGGISPGTHAPGQFLLASGGDGEAVNDGMSLFMYGGFIGTNADFSVTPAHNPCVPAIDPPPLPTIPRVNTFRGNSAPGLAEDPHLGIGLAESFLDHAGYGMYDAGLLCIGAGTNLAQELSTGLFSLVVQSLGRLVFPEDAAPLGIALRPQTPPDFTIGAGTEDDPILQIALDQMQMDFYVYSSERFIRFMTYEADLRIGINLRAEAGQLVPEIVELAPAEGTGRVFNTDDLLREDPETLATSMGLVLETAIGMFAGGIGAIDLPDIMGLQLQIPDGGIQGITDDGEAFLSIFANLAVAPSPYTTKLDTRMQIVNAEIDPTSLALDTLGQGEMPRVTLQVEALDVPLETEVEYSVRVDGMPWSRWTTDTEIVLDDETALLFQAKHTIEARARIAGEPGSVDESPAFQELIVDILPPEAELESAADGGTTVVAWDVVTKNEDLLVRYRAIGAEEWSEWTRQGDLGTLPVGELEVEVKDEAGNVGSASSSLIRGRPNPAGGGCDCAVEGQGSSKAPFTALLLLAVFVIWRRRHGGVRPARKEARGPRGRTFLFLNFLLPLALALGGCDCGGGGDDTTTTGDMMMPNEDMGPRPPLDPGLLATHLDMASQDDGSLVLAGYSPGNPPRTRYGDLVVGVWDSAAEVVDWEIVDGAPDGPVTNEPGWRDGVSAPGDDVGRWASIIVAGGQVHVAYYDQTNGALKFASGNPGGSWAIHTVDEDGNAGRYASLIETSSGVAVAYMAVIDASETPGQPTGVVRVATASGVPAAAGDWTVGEVLSKAIPCRFELCPDGAACVETGMCMAETSDCGECGSDEACVGGSCQAIFTEDWVQAHPEAVGLYASLAESSTGLALVWYDRTEGNIWGSAESGGTWGEPFLIDGYGVGDSFIGDSGIGASLAVDASDVWHVTYVDGAEENLRYARIEGGTVEAEIVDNGTTDGTTMHDDGRHLIGDDSAVVVTDGGEVRVAYQDATAGRAMFARRGGDGSWTLSIADEGDFSGFFTDQVLVGGTSFVATWWRNDSEADRGNGVRVVSID